MSAEELERLLWERLDGTMSAADHKRLEALLASEPESGLLETNITALAEQLDGVAEAPLPEGLGDDIREALRVAPGPTPERAPTPGFGNLARFLKPQPLRRMAYLAAGLLVGVVAFQLITGTVEQDPGTFSGTAGLPELDPGSPAVRLALPDSGGVLSLRQRDTTLLIELEISPALGAATLRVEAAGLAVESTGERGGATFELRGLDGAIELEVDSAGTVELGVVVPSASDPIVLTLVSDGMTLVSRQLTLEDLTDPDSITNF